MPEDKMPPLYRPEYQIIDLDGCVSDDRHRRSRIDMSLVGQARFDAYHAACYRDEFANLERIERSLKTIVITARPSKYRDITRYVLNHAIDLDPCIMIMRNDGETKPSLDLKRQMLSWLFDYNFYGLHPQQIYNAIDDKVAIVEMYRKSFGLDAYVVRIGEEEHEYA